MKLTNFLDSQLGRSLTLQLARLEAKKWTTLNVEGYNVCNLRCKMCPYSIMTRKKTLMPLELYEHLIDEAKAFDIRTINLNIYNEPLLDPLLFERVAYAKSQNMLVQFTSNGMLLGSSEISNILSTKVDRIYFSVDGATRNTYEKIRQGGDFDKVRQNIATLLERRSILPKVEIVMVVQNDNYSEVNAFHNMWKGIADDTYCWPVDNRKEEGHLPESFKASRHKLPLPCSRVFEELNVLSNGEVALCCLDYDGKQLLGDAYSNSLSDVWNSSVAQAIRSYHLEGRGDEILLCSRCDALHACGLSWWGKLLPTKLARLVSQQRMKG